jgi:hypothetical protein
MYLQLTFWCNAAEFIFASPRERKNAFKLSAVMDK